MTTTVTITVTVGAASAAELDQTTGQAIANEAKEHVLRALGTKGYSGTASVSIS